MFGEAGYLYVYVSYGMHHCVNVVTDAQGVAGAVLLRALQPLAGIELMEAGRHNSRLVELCSGPGKLCQAFGITLEQNGADLEASDLWIEDDGWIPDRVATSTRIGLSAGTELAQRYYVSENIYVSRGRPSGPHKGPQ
jgi:DNA-3-methyladenine glycosylase